MKRLMFAALLVVVVLVDGALACARNSPAEAHRVAASLSSHAKMATDGSPLQGQRKTLGLVVPLRRAELAAPRDGILKAVDVQLGAEVHRGEVLAELVDSDAIADAHLARRALDVTKAETEMAMEEHRASAARFLRLERMAKEGVASGEEFFDSSVQVRRNEQRIAVLTASENRAKAEIQRRDIEVEARKLRAPFDGVVARKVGEAGERVSVGSSVLRLISREIRIRFGVAKKASSCATLGAAIHVEDSDTLRAPLSARVLAVAPEADDEANLFWVEAMLDGDASGMAPGTRVFISSLQAGGLCE